MLVCRYSLDEKAREWAGHLAGRLGYHELPFAGKLFVSLPFMHEETLEGQQVFRLSLACSIALTDICCIFQMPVETLNA
jgi:uncharacterized protein (DUF924 family)